MNAKKHAVLAVKILLSVLLVYWIAAKVDFSRVFALVKNSYWPAVGAALAAVAANLALSAYRWQLLLLGGKRPPYPRLLKLLFISHGYNTFIPGSVAGDIYRAVKTSAASIVMDRLIGMIGMVMLWALGFAFSSELVTRTGLLKYIVAISAALCAFSVILLSRRVSSKVKWAGALAGPFRERLRDFVLSVQAYRRHRDRLAGAVLLTLSAHLLLTAAVFLIAYSLKAPVTFFNCVLFVPIIGLLSSLPVTVGGLGIREASFVLLFSSVGVEREVALSISFIFYLMLVALGAVGLGLTFTPASGKSLPKRELDPSASELTG